jgi:hypothetical protein
MTLKIAIESAGFRKYRRGQRQSEDHQDHDKHGCGHMIIDDRCQLGLQTYQRGRDRKQRCGADERSH